MKKNVKLLLLSLCAVALVAATVAGTLAYLIGKAEVVNTFTVGNVTISMDEAKVDEEGQATNDPRVTENVYHLIPGKTYDKDPTIHVEAGSEEAWLFVKVDNGLTELEADPTIAAQMTANGWTVADAANNVYAYKEKVIAGQDIKTFETFTLSKFAEFKEIVVAGQTDATAISVTAYAIQAEGFDTVDAAWAGILDQLIHEGKTL